MNKTKALTFVSVLLFSSMLCDAQLNVKRQLDYCASQAEKTLKKIPDVHSRPLPRTVEKDNAQWSYVGYRDWCSGFWPGILWYLFETTQSPQIKSQADRFSRELNPLASQKAEDHDLGFQIFSSFGNGYRLTKNTDYRRVILAAADSLSTLYNPEVGTILSWPRAVQNLEWPQHNTIIDNMLNLELLFWAAKNGGSKRLYDMAVSHATKTMKNHFRPDYTSYHVVVYDKETGKKIKGVTHQGYADYSMWARGQSWAIYGFTMCYRETGDPSFLDFAQKVTDVYLEKLPADRIPYWDFDDPAIPNAPRDASAAAVTASALLELSVCVKDKDKARFYRRNAEQMLITLSAAEYQSGAKNSAFLLHSVGHKPRGREIDASLIYSDYYYIEALTRLFKLQKNRSIYRNLTR